MNHQTSKGRQTRFWNTRSSSYPLLPSPNWSCEMAEQCLWWMHSRSLARTGLAQEPKWFLGAEGTWGSWREGRLRSRGCCWLAAGVSVTWSWIRHTWSSGRLLSLVFSFKSGVSWLITSNFCQLVVSFDYLFGTSDRSAWGGCKFTFPLLSQFLLAWKIGIHRHQVCWALPW